MLNVFKTTITLQYITGLLKVHSLGLFRLQSVIVEDIILAVMKIGLTVPIYKFLILMSLPIMKS
jgi:hypothetical protein